MAFTHTVAARDCITACKDAGRSLFNRYPTNPVKNYQSIFTECWNEEILWAKNIGTYDHWLNCADPISFNCYSILNPTQNQVDAYETAEGVNPITGYTKAPSFLKVAPESVTGVYGASSVDPGAVERHRYAVGCGNVKTMTAVIPEGTRQIAERSIEEVVKTLTFNLNPDTLLIYSNRPGSSIDTSLVERVKAVTDTPVFASNGVKVETVKDILEVCDGAVVATGIKYDGKFFNPVDPQRVKDLMKNAREARGNI